MDRKPIKTRAKIWIWSQMKGSWHFVTLNKTAQAWVVKVRPEQRRGFGSVPVRVTVGSSTWETSLFPDKKRGYVLPIKAKILKAQKFQNGDTITMTLARRI